MSFIGSIVRWFVEREARKHPLDEWPDLLAASEEKVAERFRQADDSEKKRAVGRHIIGIERWSQQRLRVFLGDALQMDEYDGYQPDASLNMAALAEAFTQTREETVSLARQIVASDLPADARVPHNDMGDVSPATWLAYINGHASRESGRLK